MVELTDICGTITCSLKELFRIVSFLLRKPPSAVVPPALKMQHFRECVVHCFALQCGCLGNRMGRVYWLAMLFHHIACHSHTLTINLNMSTFENPNEAINIC